jgi:hypothetical protein
MVDIHTVAGQWHVYVALGVALAAYSTVRYVTSPWRKVPPGPRGWPILGNALDLREKQWLKFSEWRKTYGERDTVAVA